VITFGRFGTPRAYDVPRGHVAAPRMTASLERGRQQWVAAVERLLSATNLYSRSRRDSCRTASCDSAHLGPPPSLAELAKSMPTTFDDEDEAVAVQQ
jgi:hypothetical protein